LVGFATEQVLIHEEGEWPFHVEYEEVVDTTRVRAVMVGDDSVWEFDAGDLVKLDDEDYCSCCGQIGCEWG